MKKLVQQRTFRAGFTLMETLLAVALVGVLISIFLTVFVPARRMVQQAITKQQSDRVIGILRAELGTVRASEQAADPKGVGPGQYSTPFDKGFYWLLSCKRPSTSIVVFSYRADTSKSQRTDGTYPPIPINKSRPGSDTQLVSVACPMNDRIHRRDIPHAVGPVFIVKLTHLEPLPEGNYKLANTPGSIKSAATPGKYFSEKDAEMPWGGVIFCRADFYMMDTPNPDRYRKRPWSRMGSPIFSANISFRR